MWMYRLIIESLLGLRLAVDKLYVEPCLLDDGEGFTVHYRYGETIYHIKVVQGQTSEDDVCVTVDGVVQQEQSIRLVDDGSDHMVDYVINNRKGASR